MPPSISTQCVVAFIWDFDKTLTHGYMQTPLFAEYDVDESTFWKEVNSLVDFYEKQRLKVSKDTAYLGHMLAYVRDGVFDGLSNQKLRELGAKVELAPGIPDFMRLTRELVATNERFKQHSISVEHYIVSTGLRQMIEGSAIREHVDGVWACELLPETPGPGYLVSATGDLDTSSSLPLRAVGYTLDNTAKTRAVFEINKGANKESIDVNAQIAQDMRRVPFTNMIYIADGPSDIPVFSLINKNGGKTLGVYSKENRAGVRQLEDEGRVQHIALADYSEDTDAYFWLMDSLNQICDEICTRRERQISAITPPAGHVV
ncbi:hypothetical protein TPB0596_46520 [Tsukamurella pulmonis]|uniref:haloacid dehalogenase-like hydrolase n=1 Tax=Tsukamurella pulmonis TaxID=47312 RepID=UPI001EDE0C99|nr:haloacid dehalogenase-like hydrolase [Tsukamurella pulmonis]BDD84889.1 hypothetical protein TPB0596_46520 [Tsukamurella pulmonis]